VTIEQLSWIFQHNVLSCIDLGKSFIHMPLFTKVGTGQGQWCSKAGMVIAGVGESNGSVLLGL